MIQFINQDGNSREFLGTAELIKLTNSGMNLIEFNGQQFIVTPRQKTPSGPVN